jgi:hypothetical protein
VNETQDSNMGFLYLNLRATKWMKIPVSTTIREKQSIVLKFYPEIITVGMRSIYILNKILNIIVL